MPEVITLRNARLLPTTALRPGERPGHRIYDGGVCDANSAVVALAQHRGGNLTNITAAIDVAPALRLSGEWVFGGRYRGHFGHFVNESLGRMWALPETPAGIVFLDLSPPRAGPALAAAPPILARFMDLLGIKRRVVIARAPHTVEHLVVPAQLTMGEPGSEPLRDFWRAAAPQRAGPPDHVYVSRAGLPPGNAKFIGETFIEDNLRQAGWRILRPETCSLEDQIATYRGARTLLFAEGSAVHLAAPFLHPGQRIGILWRSTRRTQHILAQLTQGAPPVEVAAFAGWIVSAVSPDMRGAHVRKADAVPDFTAMGRALAAAGFLGYTAWRDPSPAEIEAAVETALAALRAEAPEMHHAYIAGANIPRQVLAERHIKATSRRAANER